MTDPEPTALVSVLEVVQPVDGLPYFELLEDRFGIPTSRFDDYVVFQPNRQNLWIADRSLLLPVRPQRHTVGVPFFYVNMRFPRMTTLAAVKFGFDAQRNVFDARDDEIGMLLHRHEIALDPERGSRLEGYGYVMLRHHGLPIGLGFVHAEPDGHWLRGMLPRSWVVRTGIASPAEDAESARSVDGDGWGSDQAAPGP